jgi:VWFA-related protein
MKCVRYFFAVFLFVALLVTSGFAQNKEPKNDDKETKQLIPCKAEKPKGTPTPLSVSINVFVTDSTGKSVDGLKQEDIKIFENDVPQTITSFTKREGINNYGIAIDSSASVRDLIGKLVQAGQIVVRNKYEQDEVFVVSFVNTHKIFLLQDWTTDANLLQRKMDEIYVEGGVTAIIDAAYLAAEKIIERKKTMKEPRRYTLILLSDGDDTYSEYMEKQLFDILRDTGIQVFALGFIKELPEGKRKKSVGFLTRLAHETGGNVIFLVEKEYGKVKTELENALKSLIYELRSNYIVSYNSTNALRDGTTRKIRVEIKNGDEKEKYFVFARDSYIAPCN